MYKISRSLNGVCNWISRDSWFCMSIDLLIFNVQIYDYIKTEWVVEIVIIAYQQLIAL